MIVAENLSVHFRRGLLGPPIKALDGLSLEVGEGDFFALVGQNGAGKSTAMYCFLGLLRPKAGHLRVMGRVPELGSTLYECVAFLPEEPHYDLYLTVEEALRYYAGLYGKTLPAKAVPDALERLGLAEFKTLPLAKCSKGMKQKVGIAQCLIHPATLIFLDEPTRGLDPIIVRLLREVLREIHQRGATIVMNSHVLSEIEMLANRVAIIEKGRTVVQDTLENLMHLEQDSYNVAFEANADAPEWVSVQTRQGRVVRGTIPAARLHDFMEYTCQPGSRLLECSLKKATLEESFVKILKEKTP
jgi:ABC-2 type transport system ATP-binding protein